jgi:hypothetical protein
MRGKLFISDILPLFDNDPENIFQNFVAELLKTHLIVNDSFSGSFITLANYCLSVFLVFNPKKFIQFHKRSDCTAAPA